MIGPMEIVLFILMAATMVVLGIGLVNMLRGPEANKKNANKLMSARVALQAAALAVLAIMVLVLKD